MQLQKSISQTAVQYLCLIKSKLKQQNKSSLSIYTEKCLTRKQYLEFPGAIRQCIEHMDTWDFHWPRKEQLSQSEINYLNYLFREKVFTKVQRTKVIRLFLFNNEFNSQCRNILNHVQKTSFEKLKWICLSENNIQSIELISFLNAPLLERIDLNKNKIVQTKAINKTNLKNLQQLHLQQNPLKQTELSRSCWAKKIKRLSLEEEGQQNMQTQGNKQPASGPIEWIMKINADKVSHLVIKSNNRISSKSQSQTIRKRFGNETMIFVKRQMYIPPTARNWGGMKMRNRIIRD